jgi:hypothetical protein
MPSDWAIVTAGGIGTVGGLSTTVAAVFASRRSAKASRNAALHAAVIDFVTEAMAATSLPTALNDPAVLRFLRWRPSATLTLVRDQYEGLRPLLRAKTTLDMTVADGQFQAAADALLAEVLRSLGLVGDRANAARSSVDSEENLKQARLLLLREADRLAPPAFPSR